MRIIKTPVENPQSLPAVANENKYDIQSDTPFPVLTSFFQNIIMPFTPTYRRRVRPTQEVVESSINVISSWLGDKYIYNPEAYVEKYRLKIFQKMMLQSPDAKAAMTLKKLSVLSDDWEIYDNDEAPGNSKQSKFIRHAVSSVPGGFNKVIGNILEGMKFGFSLSEKVYEIIPKGEWKGLMGYKVIRDKPVYNFAIDTNKKGEIQSFTQYQDETGPVTIPTWKMVYWSYQSSSDNPYGYSDMCPAFQHVFAQAVMDESWPTALKRYAMPILIAEKRGTAHGQDQDDHLEKILTKIKEETGILLDTNVQNLRYLEQGGSNMAYSAYQKHQEYRARQIRLSCLIPDLAISEGLRVGSKSLGQIQIQSFVKNVIREIRREVAAVINEQIIRPLVDMNFADVDIYPLFSFGSSERDDDEKLANIMATWLEHGVITLEEDRIWLREKFGVPSKNVDPNLDLSKVGKNGQDPKDDKPRRNNTDEKVVGDDK